ncbi:hypothetical protein DFH06DRAFT_1128851 [Mycena polygramma]|nr:hypothetical protein DFH06DRAFT_1128851 [Mycena polygramma]
MAGTSANSATHCPSTYGPRYVECDKPSSNLEACADLDVTHKFWKRVTELTARYHDPENGWIGSPEVKKWNQIYRTACRKCTSFKSQRQCVVDEDNPSCRTCRSAKIGCDRKTQFVFDMTKEDFFSNYDQFTKVYENRDPRHLKRLKQAENSFKRSIKVKGREIARHNSKTLNQLEQGTCEQADRMDERAEDLGIKLEMAIETMVESKAQRADINGEKF